MKPTGTHLSITGILEESGIGNPYWIKFRGRRSQKESSFEDFGPVKKIREASIDKRVKGIGPGHGPLLRKDSKIRNGSLLALPQYDR